MSLSGDVMISRSRESWLNVCRRCDWIGYADLYLAYIKKHGLRMLQVTCGKMLKMIPDMEGQVTKKFQDDLDAKIAAYEKDKAKANVQAFAVIDVNKDGMLTERPRLPPQRRCV